MTLERVEPAINAYFAAWFNLWRFRVTPDIDIVAHAKWVNHDDHHMQLRSQFLQKRSNPRDSNQWGCLVPVMISKGLSPSRSGCSLRMKQR